MEDIPPHMLNQFRLFMQMQQSYEPAANSNFSPHVSGPGNPTITAALTPASTQNGASSSIISNQPINGSSTGRNPQITPYQSVRQLSAASAAQNRLFPSAPISSSGVGSLYTNASNGLPANIPAPPQGVRAASATGLGTSFLGFQQRTGQANQARLAAAAQNLPRRLPLQNRRHQLNAPSTPSLSQPSLTQQRPNRRARGPSGQRPYAHRQHPELSDVVYSPSGQGEPTHCHIRVKVLPDCGGTFSNY